MAKQLTDEELNLRRKARRRLIGAIALTLVVVAILPMVLESEPKPTGKDIELRIPSPDKAGEFLPGKTVPETALLSADSAVVAAPVQAAVVAEPVKIEPATPVEKSGAESAAASSPAVAVAGKIQVAANTQPEQKAPETTVAEHKVAAESATTDKPASPEKLVVQIGAYSNQQTAKQEVDKLKKWGFKVYTEKSDNMIRVRVGPYVEREKAEKVRQLLEKHGVQSVIMSAK